MAKERIESVLAEANIPFTTVEVVQVGIIVKIDGEHDAAGAIVSVLHETGLRRTDELVSEEEVRTEVYRAGETAYTTITLPR